MASKLNELPSDILISIVRLLEFKEATRTSTLSKIWRDLYTYHTSLDFDVDFSKELTDKQFLDSINRVLKLYRGSSMDGFRVCFALTKTSAHDIDKWVKFAILKGVKTLVLDFSSNSHYSGYICSGGKVESVYYPVPASIVMLPSYETQLKLLTSLCLKKVDVNSEVIELLLSRCSLLERLDIEYSPCSHKTVKIKSQSLKFLLLKSPYPYITEKLEIDAFNLVSLEISGMPIAVYASTPKLVQASFGCQSRNLLDSPRWSIKLVSNQLAKLSFDVEQFESRWRFIPTFGNVKDLELRVEIVFSSSRHMINLRRFFEACPSLEKEKLETNCLGCCPEFEHDIKLEEVEEERGTTMLPHLRRVDWYGEFNTQLALYIIRAANNLDKFVYDPHSPSCFRRSRYSQQQCQCAKREDKSREVARCVKFLQIC